MRKIEPWQYNEMIQIGTDYADEKEVGRYDARMQRLRNFARETETIRVKLQLPPRAAVLEIGTGTGAFALGIAPFCRRVYALDISPVMLRYARQKARGRGIANIRFQKGGFLAGPLPPTKVDAVVSQLALHHLPEFWKTVALTRVANTLKPGGRFYLSDVVFPAAVGDFAAYFRNVIAQTRATGGAANARGLARHIKNEFSTLDWILEGMLERTGFRILEKKVRGFLTGYLCVRTAVSADAPPKGKER